MNLRHASALIGEERGHAERGDELLVQSSATSVSVVIPTLNEAENLSHVLPKLPDSYEVIIVDGGSTDGTIDVARELCPRAIIMSQTRRGKGDALACGFSASRGEVIVTLDADGSARVEEIPRFVNVLEWGADFAKGSRYLLGGGSADLTSLRSTGNRVLSGVVNLLFGTRYTDLCYGYNAFWRRHIPALALDCDGFEIETLLTLRACEAGLVVIEVPSYEDARIHGVSKLRTFRDGFRVLRTILRERFRRGAPSAATAVPAEAGSADLATAETGTMDLSRRQDSLAALLTKQHV